LADDSQGQHDQLFTAVTVDRLPKEIDPLQMGLFSELEAATLFTQ
jgi:hypothetical protein